MNPGLADLVLAQARRTPDAVAVVQWDRGLTYRELTGRAAALAEDLRAAGAGRGTTVGVCHDRSPELLVALLGVLLSGAAYVPLDPTYPRRRLATIADDAALVAVITSGASLDLGVPELTVPERVAEPVGGRAGGDDLAHLIYTSGSTGRPKGVLTTHRNAVAFVTGTAPAMGAQAGSTVLCFSSPSFDAFTFDVYAPLSVGGTVALVGDTDRADPALLERFVTEHRVDIGIVTPAVLRVLDPARLPHWHTVIVGGDLVEPGLVEPWTVPSGRTFRHVYGPTETTTFVVVDELTGRWTDPLPLGRPTPGHHAHVVDENLDPVPPGEPGELLIGGPGVALGYLDRPGLTADRFVPDPFSGEPGARLYRTGDVCRLLPDGRIGFLGRRDGQVKIRGQRVELGEIEAVLREHPDVDQAVVEVVPAAAGPEVVAFVAGHVPDDLTDEAVRDWCAARLTPAMVPARVFRSDALPVNQATGKIDRAGLRELAAPADAEPDAAPAGRDLAGVWQRVLGGPPPGPDADFFVAGGHSIAVMRLVAAIRDELRRDVRAVDVFDGRTLAGLAERVERAAPLPGPDLPTGSPPTLSPSQRRMWFLDRLAPDSAAYNIAFAERLRGPLDVAALRHALTTVAERHEVLRWRVRDDRGTPVAHVVPPGEVPLSVVDVAEHDLAARLGADAGRPIDLATGPVWRAVLYRLGPDDHVLGLVLHHAVADGWSQSVLYDDLAAAYTGKPLPALPTGYADYAVWRDSRDARDGEADRAWWRDHLAGAPTSVDLPRDRPRPPVQTYAGRTASAPFPADLDAAVRALAADLGATPSLVLLAGFGEVLRRLTGRGDNVVGVVVADRAEPAFADLVGFFVDIVPVRLRTDGHLAFAEGVLACRDEFLDVTAHPAAPLERIVRDAGVPRDPSRSALVQVLFNVFNFAEPRLRLPDVAAEPVPVPVPGSPFDLTVYLLERDGRFCLDVVYNPDLFDAARIDALLADYLRLLGALAAERNAPADAVAADCPADRWRGAPDPELVRVPVPVAQANRTARLATPTEHAVAAIWCEVIGVGSVGPLDNFFDVGGHSLMMVTVQALVAERLGRTVSVVDLFHFPNVRGLAAHLDGDTGGGDAQLARATQRAAARRDRARRRTARTGTHTGTHAAEQEIQA
ncbi:amino acid adenylation domain-containing protein [Actinophytocola gossypii]|uniref:Amino acid adenylation domain-containing protein n=1 Tax=Actinophytocola gossypii TaxID=2812003 RepID=A0ABT2J248_9PSEU|nr:amino acid adenylation domain-containing protein [Actinophytocola gossypii]MCT2581931.1 amino acid adenylation domain-containing protein [Actinophytocola gossypii]